MRTRLFRECHLLCDDWISARPNFDLLYFGAELQLLSKRMANNLQKSHLAITNDAFNNGDKSSFFCRWLN